MSRNDESVDLMKRLADSLGACTANEWDERVSSLRKELAEAEGRWREALRTEREAR